MKASRLAFVIEDDHACANVLRHVLWAIDPDLRIDWVSDAERAAERIKEMTLRGESYDLIIADIFLKGDQTGFELWTLCEKLHLDTPLLIISGLPHEQFLKLTSQAPAPPSFLPKPFSPGKCRKVLETLLEDCRKEAL